MRPEKIEQFRDITEYDINQAKDYMYKVACDLRQAGFNRKASSLMNMLYSLEEWQRKI